MSWRGRARTTIQTVLAAHPGELDLAVLTKAIDAAYPFGPRSQHPYKIWLSERKKALAILRGPGGYGPARDCPACGRKAGNECIDLNTQLPCMTHLARMPPAGPLFGDQE